MANGTVTTSIVVNFGSTDADAVLTAEVDGREAADGGLNNGDTSFDPGDAAYILVHKTTNVTINNAVVSAGSMIPTGTSIVAVEEFITFPDTNEANLAKPLYGTLTTKWLGNNLGSVAVVGETKIKASISGVGVLKVNYSSLAQVYRINSPTVLNGETVYVILGVFTGSTP